MKNFAEAINKVSPQSIAVQKPKLDFVREPISQKLFNLKNC